MEKKKEKKNSQIFLLSLPTLPITNAVLLYRKDQGSASTLPSADTRYPIPRPRSLISFLFVFLTLPSPPSPPHPSQETHPPKKNGKTTHTPPPPVPKTRRIFLFYFIYFILFKKKKGTDLSSGNHGKGAVLCHPSHYNSPSPGVIALLHKGQTAPKHLGKLESREKGETTALGLTENKCCTHLPLCTAKNGDASRTRTTNLLLRVQLYELRQSIHSSTSYPRSNKNVCRYTGPIWGRHDTTERIRRHTRPRAAPSVGPPGHLL